MNDQTPGNLLRQKREEKKLTLDQVFQAIKIRVNYLQAIESDRLDQIPSQAQARGFIRLYANYLGLDPYALLEPAAPAPAIEETPDQIEIEPVISDQLEESPSEPAEDEQPPELRRKIGNKFNQGSERIKNSMQDLVDKIPFTIVRKDQQGQPPAEPKTTSPEKGGTKPAPRVSKTYSMMSKAMGDDLQKAREALGLSLADVERQIRIREFYLYAIEEGNLDELPSTVQGRGMLSNYAAFLNLDSELFLSRFADVLQQRRTETIPDEKTGVPIPVSDNKQPISGFKRLLSPDLIFTGGIFLVFFVFIIWGAFQLLGIGGSTTSNPTVIPISDLLLSSGTPTVGEMVTVQTSQPTTSAGNQFVFTPAASQEGTVATASNAPIQLTIAANRRAFMQVTVDGKTAFLGRTLPGKVYTFSGNTRISLLCGDASAIQVYYNQTNLGVLGFVGQVVKMDFTTKAAINLAANYTATPTVTQIATLTPNPTDTPTITPIAPSATTSSNAFVTDTPTP